MTETPPDGDGDRLPANVVLVVAFGEVEMRSALPFARRVAEASGGRIHLLHLVRPGLERRQSAVLPPAPWLVSLGSEANAAVETMEAEGAFEALTLAAPEVHPSLAVVALAGPGATDHRARRLVAAPPCPVLLLANAPPGFEPRKVLLATNTFAPLSRQATDLSYVLAACGEGTHVDFLRLAPMATSTEDMKAMQEGIARRIAQRNPPFTFDVIVRRARSFETGLLDALGDDGRYDLIIADAPREGLVGRLSERVLPRRLLRGATPVLLYSAPPGPLERAILGAWNRVYQAVPSASEERRVAVYATVRRNSRGDADFHVLLALSVLIASFGLLLDSAAVVIGAMIIAPLMQPILGIGLAVATANMRLGRLAARTAAGGVGLAIGLATVVGLAIPGAEVTGQLDARGQPTLLDLLVALASGAAGAYASARPGAAASAAGVAIAVALVPPLSTVGVGLALAEWPLVIGAALLFLTNFTAICAASAGMFLWMGFKPEANRFGSRAALAQGLVTVVALVAVVGMSVAGWGRASEARLERQVFGVVEIAVQGVDPEARLDGVDVDRNGSVLSIVARVTSGAGATLLQQRALIQSDITRQLERPVAMTLVVVQPAD